MASVHGVRHANGGLAGPRRPIHPRPAITDLGPPDKSAKLSDGTVVDEWLTQRSHVIVAPEPYFLGPGGYFGPDTPSYTETYVPDYFLRLTFGPDGKLRSWKTFAR